MKPLPRAPKTFEGTIAELFEHCVDLVAPSASEVVTFHRLLKGFVDRPNPGFIVRGSTDLRRSEVRTGRGLRILPSDNAPAWWVHHVLWTGREFDADSFASALETCPRHFHDVSARRENGISAAGWYVAHILPAKFGSPDPETWNREEAVMRFVRNVHPTNHFYVPGGRAIGEDRRVIAYAARWASERYGRVWNEMLSWAGPQAQTYLESLQAVTGQERITLLPSEPSLSPKPRAALNSLGLLGPIPEIHSTRLHFKADVIEPLGMDDLFRIVSPVGTFEMTKREFYEVFANVVASASYRAGRHDYHYTTVPAKAERFRVST
jgi:hypothetical protein